MASTTIAVPTKTVQRTVFDLAQFADITLKKSVPLPTPVTSIEEAQKALGNSVEELLKVINAGLEDRYVNEQKAVMDGFQVENEEGELEPYTGKYVDDEEMGAKINNAVLAIAKMQGYEKSLPKEKKREIKEKARQFFRDNPAMLGSLV